MAVSRRLRFEVLRRDNHTCRYCGGTAPDVVLTVDHVIPRALGGGDEPSNLVAACKDCNSGKSSVPADATLVGDVSAAAVRWRDAMVEASNLLYDEVRRPGDVAIAEFDAAWKRFTYVGSDEHLPLPFGWRDSIRQLVKSGLSDTDLPWIVDSAMSPPNVQDRFRYFCGIAWKHVRAVQQRALELLEDEKQASIPAERPVADVVSLVADAMAEPYGDI
jgi:hypothetical protein